MSTIGWTEHGTFFAAHWHSENAAPAPTTVVAVDDHITADAACRLARNGTGMVWRGDFHNARQLLKAMDRRLPQGSDFHSQRAARAERAKLLGKLLILVESDHSVALRRAPDTQQACDHAYGAPTGRPMCVSLPELLGVLSAHQWHRKGVEVPALNAHIHPDYGVFSPIRGEYVDLVAETPFPTEQPRVFDLGTGTGVLAAVLAQRGARVVATDINERAVACARANLHRLGLADRTRVVAADLWPGGRADVAVCNPPWLPGHPTSALERAIYDPESAILHRFLADHSVTSRHPVIAVNCETDLPAAARLAPPWCCASVRRKMSDLPGSVENRGPPGRLNGPFNRCSLHRAIQLSTRFV